jgi:hypothetical protein
LAHKIFLNVLPHFKPHHYQMDGICKVLAGVDLVAGMSGMSQLRFHEFSAMWWSTVCWKDLDEIRNQIQLPTHPLWDRGFIIFTITS